MLKRVLELLKDGTFSRVDDTTGSLQISARIMLTAERQVPALSDLVQVIKVRSISTVSLFV